MISYLLQAKNGLLRGKVAEELLPLAAVASALSLVRDDGVDEVEPELWVDALLLGEHDQHGHDLAEVLGEVAHDERHEVLAVDAVNHAARLGRIEARLLEGSADERDQPRPLVQLGNAPKQPPAHRNLKESIAIRFSFRRRVIIVYLSLPNMP